MSSLESAARDPVTPDLITVVAVQVYKGQMNPLQKVYRKVEMARSHKTNQALEKCIKRLSKLMFFLVIIKTAWKNISFLAVCFQADNSQGKYRANIEGSRPEWNISTIYHA